MSMENFNMRSCALTAALASIALAAPLQAQDSEREPTFGSIELAAGFTPDPHEIDVQAGGRVDANAAISAECIGMVPQAPAVNLNYEAGEGPLVIGVRSDVDTTLAVFGPDESWSCDDDLGGDLQPLVTFEEPQSGVYAIWIGVYDREARRAPATLTLSGSLPPPVPVYSLPSRYGAIEIGSGFEPHEVEVEAGGAVDAAATIGGDCTGMISQAPDFQVYFEAGEAPLVFSVASEGDTTLVVNAPDASWVCNADDAGAPDPRVVFDPPVTGIYDIWVGAASAEAGAPEAVLTISEAEG